MLESIHMGQNNIDEYARQELRKCLKARVKMGEENEFEKSDTEL